MLPMLQTLGCNERRTATHQRWVGHGSLLRHTPADPAGLALRLELLLRSLVRLAHHLVVLQRRCKHSRVAGPTIRGCCGLSAGSPGKHLLLQRAHALFVEQVELEGDDLKLRSTACQQRTHQCAHAYTHARQTRRVRRTRACRHTPSTRMANEDDYGMVWHGSHRLRHQTVQRYCHEPREPFRYSWVRLADRTLLPTFQHVGQRNATQRKAPWAPFS